MDYFKAYKKYKRKYKTLLFGGGDQPPQPPAPPLMVGNFIPIPDNHNDIVMAPDDNEVFQIDQDSVLGTLSPDLIGQWAIRATVTGQGFSMGGVGYLGYIVCDQYTMHCTHHVIEYQSGEPTSYRYLFMRTLRSSEVQARENQLLNAIPEEAVPAPEPPDGNGQPM